VGYSDTQMPAKGAFQADTIDLVIALFILRNLAIERFGKQQVAVTCEANHISRRFIILSNQIVI
jgi:hypothetical protein